MRGQSPVHKLLGRKVSSHTKKQPNTRPAGFTVVEVMIVLVIASAIILIVFLAVPAAQRNSRNVKRRADASYLIGLTKEKKAANGHVWPNSCNNRNNNTSCHTSVSLLMYDVSNLPANTRTVSYAKLDSPWPNCGNDGCSPEELTANTNLDPNDETIHSDTFGTYQYTNMVQLRTYAKCKPNGEYTGEGAEPDDMAAQFLIETASGWQLQCVEN